MQTECRISSLLEYFAEVQPILYKPNAKIQKKSSISRGNVPFLGRFPRLIDTFLLTAEDFLLTKLQVGTPVEYEKQPIQLLQLVTTYASRVAILLHGKQQYTTLRLGHSYRLSLRSVVHSCFPCSNLWSTRASKRRCPREALFKVVKVVQVVFLYVHVSVPVKALL